MSPFLAGLFLGYLIGVISMFAWAWIIERRNWRI